MLDTSSCIYDSLTRTGKLSPRPLLSASVCHLSRRAVVDYLEWQVSTPIHHVSQSSRPSMCQARRPLLTFVDLQRSVQHVDVSGSPRSTQHDLASWTPHSTPSCLHETLIIQSLQETKYIPTSPRLCFSLNLDQKFSFGLHSPKLPNGHLAGLTSMLVQYKLLVLFLNFCRSGWQVSHLPLRGVVLSGNMKLTFKKYYLEEKCGNGSAATTETKRLLQRKILFIQRAHFAKKIWSWFKVPKKGFSDFESGRITRGHSHGPTRCLCVQLAIDCGCCPCLERAPVRTRPQ